MAVKEELLSHLSVIPLFKLDLDGTLTAAELVQIKNKNRQRRGEVDTFID